MLSSWTTTVSRGNLLCRCHAYTPNTATSHGDFQRGAGEHRANLPLQLKTYHLLNRPIELTDKWFPGVKGPTRSSYAEEAMVGTRGLENGFDEKDFQGCKEGYGRCEYQIDFGVMIQDFCMPGIWIHHQVFDGDAAGVRPHTCLCSLSMMHALQATSPSSSEFLGS